MRLPVGILERPPMQSDVLPGHWYWCQCCHGNDNCQVPRRLCIQCHTAWKAFRISENNTNGHWKSITVSHFRVHVVPEDRFVGRFVSDTHARSGHQSGLGPLGMSRLREAQSSPNSTIYTPIVRTLIGDIGHPPTRPLFRTHARARGHLGPQEVVTRH